MQRRLLAPRSVFFAGVAGGGVLVLSLTSRRLRRALFTTVPEGERLSVLFVALQAAICVAVVVNLHAYFLRAYGQRPLWQIGEEEVLNRALPYVWSEALALKQTLPESARLAVRMPPLDDLSNAAGDKFMLHGLAYPVALFDLSPATEDWRDDLQFIGAARRYDVHYILDLRHRNRGNSLSLEPFQWELSGWRR